MTNAQKVSYLIGGLENWQHVTTMVNDTPADIDEFMTRLRNSRRFSLHHGQMCFPSPHPNNLFFQPSTLPPVRSIHHRLEHPSLPQHHTLMSDRHCCQWETISLDWRNDWMDWCWEDASAKFSTSQIIMAAFSVERTGTSREITIVEWETARSRRLDQTGTDEKPMSKGQSPIVEFGIKAGKNKAEKLCNFHWFWFTVGTKSISGRVNVTLNCAIIRGARFFFILSETLINRLRIKKYSSL